MKAALKPVLLGTLAAIALCPSFTATASAGEAKPTAGPVPGFRWCTKNVKTTLGRVELAPGEEIQAHLWTQYCRGDMSVHVVEGRGLLLTLQRAGWGAKWSTVASGPRISWTSTRAPEVYRILVKNTSANQASSDVVHVVGVL